MLDIKELITSAMEEGCAVYADETDPSMFNTFFENVESELRNHGWKNCTPCSEIDKEYATEKIFSCKDRFAIISTEKGFGHVPTMAIFKILSTIEYEVFNATRAHHCLALYRWDLTPLKAIEALNKCGWVVMKPGAKIASAYADFNGATFFERGDMFAVTGLQSIPSDTFSTEAAIIINYKNKFDD